MTSQQVLQKTRMIGSMGPVHCAVGSANIFGIACHNDFWNIWYKLSAHVIKGLLRSLVKRIHLVKMGLKLGHLEGHLSYFEAQLGSHFNKVKYLSNDLKLLGYSDFVSNFKNHGDRQPPILTRWIFFKWPEIAWVLRFGSKYFINHGDRQPPKFSHDLLCTCADCAQNFSGSV